MEQMVIQYRHGDVFVFSAEIPVDAEEENREGDVVLAFGEVTGHAHRIRNRHATTFSHAGHRYLRVAPEARDTLSRARYDELGAKFGGFAEVFPVLLEGGGRVTVAGVVLDHEEHGAIPIAPGDSEITIQREYTPEGDRRVAD